MKDIRKIISIFFIVIVFVVLGRFTTVGTVTLNIVRAGFFRVSSVGYRLRATSLGQTEQTMTSSTFPEVENSQLKTENANLRDLLQFKQKKMLTTIGAEVMGRSYDPSRATIVIDRGSRDGVKQGSPIVAGSGVLVGMVITVDEGESMVRLLTDPQSRVAGRLLNEKQTEGVITGGHGIIVRVELVPRSEVIPHDTPLITSGLDAHIPSGLSIGRVTTTEQDVNSLFQRVIIAPAVDYSTLQRVLVGME